MLRTCPPEATTAVGFRGEERHATADLLEGRLRSGASLGISIAGDGKSGRLPHRRIFQG